MPIIEVTSVLASVISKEKVWQNQEHLALTTFSIVVSNHSASTGACMLKVILRTNKLLRKSASNEIYGSQCSKLFGLPRQSQTSGKLQVYGPGPALRFFTCRHRSALGLCSKHCISARVAMSLAQVHLQAQCLGLLGKML